MSWKYEGISYDGTSISLAKPLKISTETSNSTNGALAYSTESGLIERFDNSWRALYQNAQAYTPPSWPSEELDEIYRAGLESTSVPFANLVGTAQGTAVSGTLNFSPSFYFGKVAAMVASGSWRVHGEPLLQRNTSWTVDLVCANPELAAAQVMFLLANTASGNIKGGLQYSGTGFIQVWTPSGWVNVCTTTGHYYGINISKITAWTVQWGDDNIVRVWGNGFLFYESGVLTPPAVVGDEGIIATNSPLLLFFRYRASAPATPYTWQSAALYGS